MTNILKPIGLDWFANFLTSSIGRKLLMSLSGLFQQMKINLESFQIIFILKMMEVPLREVSFSQFIQYFPILPLPVVLAEENINIFTEKSIFLSNIQHLSFFTNAYVDF